MVVEELLNCKTQNKTRKMEWNQAKKKQKQNTSIVRQGVKGMKRQNSECRMLAI